MTFSQYVQNLGILLALAAPFAGLVYLAVRLGVQHGSALAFAALKRSFIALANNELSGEQRQKLPTERE